MIEEVAPGLTRICLRGADSINVYLLGDVLVDAGVRFTASKLLSALRARAPAVHALTHAHFDHQGASAAVCCEFGIPLWCGEGDRAAVESGRLGSLFPRPPLMGGLLDRLVSGPGHPVARVLRDGDVVGEFTVIETPGHTPGHLAFWRERDRALVLGDVLFHRNPVTGRFGLREPFAKATYDIACNRASARRLAALAPSLVCFGHGPPLRDPELFWRFVTGLG